MTDLRSEADQEGESHCVECGAPLGLDEADGWAVCARCEYWSALDAIWDESNETSEPSNARVEGSE